MTVSVPVRIGLAAAARCLALDQGAAAAVAALDAAAVPSLLLKGPGLARRLYGDDPGRRRYTDIDLLVSPTDFHRAQTALRDSGCRDAAAGLREHELGWHERPWLLPGVVPLTIDLHRGFAGVDDPLEFWAAMMAGTERIDVAGRMIAVPDAVGCALVVALHAANPGRGRKALADLGRALEVLPADDWAAAATLALRSWSTAAFAAGLRRLPAGAAHADRLGLTPTISPLQVLTARQAEPTARALATIATLGSPWVRVRHIWRRLLPSVAYMRRISGLANHGRAGLAAAYAVRLGVVVTRTPAAVHQLALVRAGGGSTARLPRTAVAARARRALGPRELRACLWAGRARRHVRRQLARAPLDHVRLAAPPRGGDAAAVAVRRTLRITHASCLERALVLQRWHGG